MSCKKTSWQKPMPSVSEGGCSLHRTIYSEKKAQELSQRNQYAYQQGLHTHLHRTARSSPHLGTADSGQWAQTDRHSLLRVGALLCGCFIWAWKSLRSRWNAPWLPRKMFGLLQWGCYSCFDLRNEQRRSEDHPLRIGRASLCNRDQFVPTADCTEKVDNLYR